jgi:hypothetical protein
MTAIIAIAILAGIAAAAAGQVAEQPVVFRCVCAKTTELVPRHR